MHKHIIVETKQKKEIIDLTHRTNVFLAQQEKSSGICTLFVQHTTACLTTGEIGEGTDEDLLEVAENIIPRIDFRHAHDPSHAWSHMASSFIGPSLSIPFEDHKLVLGTWQSILFVELNGPRERKVILSVHG